MGAQKKINRFIYLTNSYFSLYFETAISVFLFVLFFQPFAPDKFEFENKLLFLGGVGVIVLIILFVGQIIFHTPLLIKEKNKPDNAIHLPLYYLYLVIAGATAIVFYIRYVGEIYITFNIAVRIVFICMSLPVIMHLKISFDTYKLRIKNLLLEKRLLQDKLKHFSENYSNKHIEIISDNDSDNLRIQVAEIVYVKSADNYVEIGYHDSGSVKKKMLRNTLKKVEQQLSEFNNFIRTHRSALVNIQYIDKLNKNFNSYWLSLNNTKDTVPVSRQYLMSVKELL